MASEKITYEFPWRILAPLVVGVNIVGLRRESKLGQSNATPMLAESPLPKRRNTESILITYLWPPNRSFLPWCECACRYIPLSFSFESFEMLSLSLSFSFESFETLSLSLSFSFESFEMLSLALSFYFESFEMLSLSLFLLRIVRDALALSFSLSRKLCFKTWLESLGSKVFGSAFNDAIDPWSTDGKSVSIDLKNLRCHGSWKNLFSREIWLIFLNFLYFLRFEKFMVKKVYGLFLLLFFFITCLFFF